MLETNGNSSIPSNSGGLNKKTLKKILDSFSNKQTVLFILLFVILTASTLSILGSINKSFMIYLPERGGSFSEGIFGNPRFINPILATSDTDRDLSILVYAGLMKKTPDGEIVPDLAESYDVSEGGLTYTFKIREDAVFHNKKAITADDVVFTIEKIKDPLVKSPMQAIWDGVVATRDDVDNRTVVFKLTQPYASFLDNATVGIIPKSVWGNIEPEMFSFSDNNIEAIGSGPYRIKDIDQNKAGQITEVSLSSFDSYAGEKPFIKNIDFKFYENEADLVRAYRKGRVDQISSVSPKNAEMLSEEGYEPTTTTLSRVFGIFLNPNKNEYLRNNSVIKAINLALDKENVVNTVLYGFGTVIDGPVPLSLMGSESEMSTLKINTEKIAEANSLLDVAGFRMNETTGIREKDGKQLRFSISTADVAELRQASDLIKSDLSKVGIEVSVKVFDVGALNQNIIRPREYEALFFGQVIRNDTDLFAFWHSSQRNDPGLNIAVYTNNRADKLLEEIIATPEPDIRDEKVREFNEIVREDSPAIFMYSPDLIYMESGKVKNITLDRITNSSERFLGINEWYIRTDAVWEFLQPKEKTEETNQ